MKKRGISPLVATILIIGFVIILAALIMTWGLDMFRNMREQQKKGEIDLICLNEIRPNLLKSCSSDPRIEVVVDNPAEREIVSSLFRVKGSISTDVIKDTRKVGKFETTTFDLPLHIAKVGIPQKIEFIPYIVVDGKEWACDIKKVEKELVDCPCITGQDKPCGIGIGECKLDVINCVNEKWTECTVVWPSNEVCDEKDNDCDGVKDEGCSCSELSRACGIDRGICEAGTQTCTNNMWGECGGNFKGPETEICYDKPFPLDNDCDGFIDEGCECEIATPPVVRECYTGPVETENIGACHGGSQICNLGIWGACIGEEIPKPEICDNNVDDNCDGTINNACACLKSIGLGIENLKINFFNKNISFDFNNELIDITKFKVKIYSGDGVFEGDTNKGAVKNKYTKGIEAYFDFMAIGFGEINKIEIYPYVGEEVCSGNIYSTSSIDYYDLNGRGINQIWRIWDDDAQQDGSSINEEKVYSGSYSLEYPQQDGKGDKIINIASGTVPLDEVDYLIFALSANNEGVYYFLFFGLDFGLEVGYKYMVGTHPCQLGGTYGGWDGHTAGMKWRLVNIDMETPRNYKNGKCGDLVARPTSSISQFKVRVPGPGGPYGENQKVYLDSLYFYKIK